MLTIQAKPVKDLPELLPVCFLSGQTNPLLNPQSAGDMSISCGHLFVRSFAHFEVLPLVEFVPAPGLSDEDALELIRTPPPSDDASFASIAVAGLLAALFVPRRRMWVKATVQGPNVRIEYAGLARGEDPTLDATVERFAGDHGASLAGRGASKPT